MLSDWGDSAHLHRSFIGVSLSKPHTDHDNGPHVWNNGMSVSIPCVCCTLVPKIRLCPEMLHVFLYIDVFTCMIYNCTRLNSKGDSSHLSMLWRLSTKTGKRKHGFSHWDSGAVATCTRQLANSAPVSRNDRRMGWLYCCLHPWMWIRNNQWADLTAVLWHT